MMTRFLILLALLFVPAGLCRAESVEKWYYVGEAKLSGPSGQSFGSQAFLLEKTHDPDKSLIVERAVVAKADHTVDEYTMNLKVNGSAFTITDAAKTIQGSGTLFGPAWRWSYFKAEYTSTNGARIEDENYMADPAVLVARKKITAPDGKVVMYMDITLKAVTGQTFDILASSLLKK